MATVMTPTALKLMKFLATFSYIKPTPYPVRRLFAAAATSSTLWVSGFTDRYMNVRPADEEGGRAVQQ
jgi:hypothetical protein